MQIVCGNGYNGSLETLNEYQAGFDRKNMPVILNFGNPTRESNEIGSMCLHRRNIHRCKYTSHYYEYVYVS